MHRLMLTFDIEDFINLNSLSALCTILEMLNKYKFRGLFFITGHMAEKLSNFPEILDLLKNHEIGFHSSGHSVHPTIPEYTDIRDYDQAYQLSIKRETAHINPLTGKLEGEGGIPEVVKDHRTGILTPLNNPVALAEAIQYLLDNKDVRNRYGREGRRKVIENYSLQESVEKLTKIYKQIIS